MKLRFFTLGLIVLLTFSCGEDENKKSPTPNSEEAAPSGESEEKQPGELDAPDISVDTPKKDENPTNGPDLSQYLPSQAGVFHIKADWKLPLICCDAGEQEVALTFLKEQGAIPNKVVIKEFHPRMPKMGHGTDESTQSYHQVDSTTNVIKVSGIYFNMGGKPGGWVVNITAEVDGSEDKISLSLPEVK